LKYKHRIEALDGDNYSSSVNFTIIIVVVAAADAYCSPFIVVDAVTITIRLPLG